MGAGIDTNQFSRNEKILRKSNTILSLGRISPVKKIEHIIEGLEKVHAQGVAFTASLYGDPTSCDGEYYKQIREKGTTLEEKGVLSFHRSVANTEAPEIYNQHEIFINATPRGSFDKTVLEAAASEMVVITCNDSFRGIVRDEFIVREDSVRDLATKIIYTLKPSHSEKKSIGEELRKCVVGEHDVQVVVKGIYDSIYLP